MKLIYYFWLSTIFLGIGCSSPSPITGTIKMPAGSDWASKVYLLQPENFEGIAASYLGTVIDSAVIKEDGSFAFNHLPNAAEKVLLQVAIQKKEERFPNKLNNTDLTTANYFPIVWSDGEQLTISTDAAHFQQRFTINNPSAENAALLQLRDIRYNAFEKYLSGNKQHEEDQLLEAETAFLSFQKTLMEFAEEATLLLPALVAIRWVSVNGNYERIPEFIFGQCQKWQALAPQNEWVQQLCKKGNRAALPVMIGDEIPDFPLPMLSGEKAALQSLLGEKLTIIDLWASWCAPCRRENRRTLVPIWEKYQKKGVQIIGYALDADQATWEDAINKDGANRWLHASHLQGDDSPFFKRLRISTIPANYLVNSNGEVVAKNLHGETLTRFVEDFLRE